MNKIIYAVALLFLAGSANASIIYTGTGLSGTFQTENFDINSGHQSAAGSQFSGITFGSGDFVSNNYNGTYPNMTNSVIANFEPCCQDPTSFIFDFDLSDLAFAFVSNPQATTFSAYLDGLFVEVATLSTDYSGNYVNVSGILFDEIRITSTGNNDAYIIDDMQFRVADVPEPASIALLCVGLAGIGFARKKKTT